MKVFTFPYRDLEDTAPSPNATKYAFTLTPASIVPTTELLRYLASTATDPSDFNGKNDAIKALNIIVARKPNFDPEIYNSGANKFFKYPNDANDYIRLGEGLIALRGYYSSVRPATDRILLNLNAQVSPFYPAISLLDLFNQFGHGDKIALENFVHFLRVKTSHIKGSDGSPMTRVKTIIGFSRKYAETVNAKGEKTIINNAKGDYGNAQQITFECAEVGGEITVENYFKRKYGITLRVPRAFVPNCGT